MYDWECVDVKNCTVYLDEVFGWVLAHIGPNLLGPQDMKMAE